MKRPWTVLLLYVLLSVQFTAPAQKQTMIGHAAPDFSLQDVGTKRPVRLSSFRGKVVLLSFWATWCAPCLTDLPVFGRWQAEAQPGSLQVIGVSMDDAAQDVVTKRDQLRVRFPVVMGNAPLAREYGGVYGLPVTFLINTHGVVVRRFDDASLGEMREQLDRLLRAHHRR